MQNIELPPEKRVGHLKLLREPRRITSREFNALSPEERLDIIRRTHGRQRYNLLIEAEDAEALLQKMAAQEVYLLIKELGSEYAADLVLMADVEQFTTFFDLDCWQGDIFDGAKGLQWLSLLLEGGEEKILQTVRELDFELLVLLVKKHVKVLHGPEDIEDDDIRVEAVQRDGGYEIEYRDEESAKSIGMLLNTLLRGDGDFYQRLLEAVRWEQEALLEEEVYQWRRGRLLDQGFPDPFEAMAVYAPLSPERFVAEKQQKTSVLPGEKGVPPGFYLTAARPGGILAEVLAGGIREEIAWELSYLINKVLIADRVDVGDVAQVQETSEAVYRYLNLALEQLSDGDSLKAAALFDEIYLEHLFRFGFSLTLHLRQHAEQIRKSPVGSYLDGPFRALVTALLHKKPRFFEGLSESDRGGERSFATLRDLTLTEEWLRRLEVQRRLFDGRLGFDLPTPQTIDLAGCYPEDAEDLTLTDFFLTALGNRILGRAFVPEPIPQTELSELHRRISHEGSLDETLRRETIRWLDSLEPGAGAFGGYCLDLWQEEFCHLRAADIDPRYGCGLIVRT